MVTDTLDTAEFCTTVFVPEDVLTPNGNVITPAGVYPATPDEVADNGWVVCTIWTTGHYAGINRVGLPAWRYTRTEAPPAPVPEHDCVEYSRSDVTSSFIYCGICQEVLA